MRHFVKNGYRQKGYSSTVSVKGDQKRVFTPEMAAAAGSNYLVIGRPITQHENPFVAFKQIKQEISKETGEF